MKILIIGSGVAAISAAETLRKNSSDCEIEIITKEKTLPYYRTRLAEIISGKSDIANILLKKENFYNINNIKINLGVKAEKIDIINKCVNTKEKNFKYDKLLIATGANSFIPPVSGLESDNVFALRDIEDAKAIKEKCKNAKSVLVLGGGLLGLEMAYNITSICENVTVLESFDRILPRQLDLDGSLKLEELLTAKELSFIKGEALAEYKENKALLKSGFVINADTLLVCAGVRPNISLAKESGIKTDFGIQADEFLKTSEKDIFAVGDCALVLGKNYGLWLPAMEQGKAAALNILNTETKYNPTPPESRLKVAGISLLSFGEISSENATEYKNLTENSYSKVIVKDNVLIGAISIGDDAFALKISKVVSGKENVSTLIN